MGALNYLLVPLMAQGLVTMVDEFYFHHQRGLGRWEILGHPLDTLTVGAAYAFLLLTVPSELNLWVYGAICAFSCLFVTKDEFVHKQLCSAQEQWLHSLLFILHPLAFVAAGLLWWRGEMIPLVAQAGMISFFFFYQIIYWGKPWRTLTK